MKPALLAARLVRKVEFTHSMRMFTRLMVLLFFAICPIASMATEKDMFHHSGLPIPRFVSLKSDEMNVRVGPGKRYPIRWVYKRKHLPVEVIEEFGHWRKIRDHSGDEGWAHRSLLSGKRTVLIYSKQPQELLISPDEKSKAVARLSPDVAASIVSCDAQWCHLMIGEFDGWMKRASLWGIYEDETISER